MIVTHMATLSSICCRRSTMNRTCVALRVPHNQRADRQRAAAECPPPRPEQWLAAQRDEDRARMAKDCELSGMYQNPESHQQDIQLGMAISTSNMV